MHEGIAQTAPTLPYKPNRRGGGTLKIIFPEEAMHLNPHAAMYTGFVYQDIVVEKIDTHTVRVRSGL